LNDIGPFEPAFACGHKPAEVRIDDPGKLCPSPAGQPHVLSNGLRPIQQFLVTLSHALHLLPNLEPKASLILLFGQASTKAQIDAYHRILTHFEAV
jgi:hypothetical protein